jgi:hypothetical protein
MPQTNFEYQDHQTFENEERIDAQITISANGNFRGSKHIESWVLMKLLEIHLCIEVGEDFDPDQWLDEHLPKDQNEQQSN